MIYICCQPDKCKKDKQRYGLHENTRLEYLRKLRDLYSFRGFSDAGDLLLQDYLMPLAMENVQC